MKPLPRENTIWEFLRARTFMIFGTSFTVSSKTHILSIFYRILSVLGLHFGTLGPTFLGLFFRSGKTQQIFLLRSWVEAICDPSGRRGELGGIWFPFRYFSLVDLTLGGAWASPWDHPGSTFASRPQKTSKEYFF